MKRIPLTRGKFAIVDDCDFDFINQWKWHFNSRYARRSVIDKYTHKQKSLWMHRLINKTPDGMLTDHINGDELDNRRSNLRNASCSQNNQNSKKPRNKKSKYRGVFQERKYRRWRAQIRFNNTCKYLGMFKSEIAAARAYNDAAIRFHGEYATLNEIPK